MKKIIQICVVWLCSCKTNINENGANITSFRFPITVQQPKFDSLEQWEVNGINEVYPEFMGQYNFADTVNFDGKEKHRNIDENQYKWEQNAYAFDTLSSDGLQIYTDYNKTINFNSYSESKKGRPFFPVYVVNETIEPKLFIAKDSYVFAIQEAVDKSDYNNWYAIEARGFDFCGNGYFRRKLLPKEFIVFLMPKYTGADTTYLRTRIKIGESVIISKPYKAVFNKEQFKVASNFVWAEELKKSGYKWMFYGGVNKE